jgi:NAD(P)-dependent dehydrogenase (short-subunit alcohol dehydrogenase family)
MLPFYEKNSFQFAEGDPAEWEKMVGVNVWGALNLTRTILPSMLANRRGKVSMLSKRRGKVSFLSNRKVRIQSDSREKPSILSNSRRNSTFWP